MGTSSTPRSPNLSQIPENFVSLESDSTPSGGSVQSPRKRPPGTKKEKEAKRKSKMAEEKDAKFCSLLEAFNKNALDKQAENEANRAISGKRVEIEERRIKAMEEMASTERKEVEMKEREHDMQIMNMDLSEIADPQKRQYYALLKNDIMEKMIARQPPQPYFPDFSDFSQE